MKKGRSKQFIRVKQLKNAINKVSKVFRKQEPFIPSAIGGGAVVGIEKVLSAAGKKF